MTTLTHGLAPHEVEILTAPHEAAPVGPLPAFVTSIEIVGEITPTQLVRSLLKDPKAAMHVYALLGAVLTNEGHLPKAERPPVEKITLAEALREHMHVHRMSRADLARDMEVSYPYLCQLLDGSKTPGAKALAGLTRAGVDTTLVAY